MSPTLLVKPQLHNDHTTNASTTRDNNVKKRKKTHPKAPLNLANWHLYFEDLDSNPSLIAQAVRATANKFFSKVKK